MNPIPSIIGDPVVELLVILGEECAEVLKEISKMQRFGVNHVGPGDGTATYSGAPARDFFAHELGQLQEMIDIARRAGIVSAGPFDNGRRSKRIKLPIWSNLPAEWIKPPG